MSLEKLKTVPELAAISAEFAARGRKLVFTNGCFDLLHPGHVRYLAQARALLWSGGSLDAMPRWETEATPS